MYDIIKQCMTLNERTSLRLSENNIKILNEKYPEINLSRFLNNILEYILVQNEEFVREFFTKKPY